MKKPNEFVMLLSAGLGIVGTIAHEYLVLIILVAVAIALDVVSGLIRAGATGEPITSEKGSRGFWKKMILLFSMAFAFFLDIAIPTVFDVVNISLPFEKTLLFGSVVGVYIILNESISIAENIYKANKKALPKWLKRLLTGARDEIDKKGQGNENTK